MFKHFKETVGNHYVQGTRYLSIALVSFVVDYSFFWSLLKCLKGLHYLVATVFGYIAGVFVNYILSISWAFKNRQYTKNPFKELGIFFAIEISALLILSIIMFLLTHFCKITPYISKILANSLVALWNYAFKYKLLFKKKIASTASLTSPPPLPHNETNYQ